MRASQQKQIAELQARIVALENNLAFERDEHSATRAEVSKRRAEIARLEDDRKRAFKIGYSRTLDCQTLEEMATALVEQIDHARKECAEAKRMESDATDRQVEEAIRRLNAEKERDAAQAEVRSTLDRYDALLSGQAKTIAEYKERAEKAERDLVAANRELERWRHCVQVEGDYVCPDSLRAYEAEKCAETMERERDVATAQAMALQAEVIQLRAALDSADCTHREGGDTRHCRPDAPCWRCRAEKAAADAAAMRSALEQLKAQRVGRT